MNTSSLLKNPLMWTIGILIIIGLWCMGTYNSFVSLKGAANNAWAQVEVQYQRRLDLVPNLVSTVKGAASFEQETFTKVVEARKGVSEMGAATPRAEKVAAMQQFDRVLSQFIVTVEAYPTLKATQAFTDLMTQLEGTENRISVARKDYNDAVMTYNVRLQKIPGGLIGRLFGFTPETVFTAEKGSEKAPAVDFTK